VFRFTGRDIKAVTTNAVLQCFREAKKENESITEEDFLKVSMTTVRAAKYKPFCISF